MTIMLRAKITFVGPRHVASFIYQAVNDWNILSNEAKNISDILPFKRCIRSILYFIFIF